MAKKIDPEKLEVKPASNDSLAAQVALKAGGYIKGHGTQARVMDRNHSPLFNMSAGDLQWLKHHKIVRSENNVWILNELQ